MAAVVVAEHGRETLREFSHDGLKVYWDIVDNAHRADPEINSRIIREYRAHYVGLIKRAEAARGAHSVASPFMIDVGAHAGLASLPVAAAGYRVLSIEPNPTSMRALRVGALANGVNERVTIVEAVVGDHHGGWTNLYVPNGRADTSSTCINTMSSSAAKHVVPLVRLDELVFGEEEGSVRSSHKWLPTDARLLKINVQGAELSVLRGATRFLREASNLTIEMGYDPALFSSHGFTGSEILSFILSVGYIVVHPMVVKCVPDIDLFVRSVGVCDMIIERRHEDKK